MKYNRQGKIYKNEDDQKKTTDGENKEKRMIHHIQYTKNDFLELVFNILLLLIVVLDIFSHL